MRESQTNWVYITVLQGRACSPVLSTHINTTAPVRKMNKLILFSFLLCCLVAGSLGRPDNRPKLTLEARRTWNPGMRQDSFKASQDLWRSRNGMWSAGGYVQHDRTKFSGGPNIRNTHGGFQLQGRF